MATAIFEIEKERNLLRTYNFPQLPITKETVEAALLSVTGLNPAQYEVYYLDSQNDLIMTVVEEDYSIAEQTLEDDTIVFHIVLKVDQHEVHFQEQPHEQLDERASSGDLSDDEGQEAEHKEIYQSAAEEEQDNKRHQKQQELVQEKNQTEISYQSKPEDIKINIIQHDNRPPVSGSNEEADIEQSESQEELSQNESASECSSVEENTSKTGQQNQNQNKHENENKLEQQNSHISSSINESIEEHEIIPKEKDEAKELHNYESLLIQLIQDDSLINGLFAKLCQKLPEVLKKDCFKNNSSQLINIKSKKCHICEEKIDLVPYYLSQDNELICEKCEPKSEAEFLIKVRSQQQLQDLVAVKSIPIYNDDLSIKDQSHLESEEINQIAIRKIQRSIKRPI